MSQNINNQIRIMWFGDLVTPSGFGRIGNEVCAGLVRRGYQVMGLSLPWSGYPPNVGLPFPVVPVGGPDWAKIAGIIREQKPDVVVCCQDFPYAQMLFEGARLDWSKMAFMVVTPIDGTPVHPIWTKLAGDVDSTLVISAFGVEAMRLQGRRVGLLPPGVNTAEFYPAEDGEVVALREKLGIAPDAFVVGMFAMNQGRKCVSQTVAVFKEFALDKPDAVLYLDMEKQSPAGWDIPSLCKALDPHEQTLKVGKNVLFKEDAFKAELLGLRERYLLCDLNSVISHREGFGLPLVEAQACKIVSVALDYCSGPEICSDGRGCLVRRINYMEPGTWGNARDAFPDMGDWLTQLNRLYNKPDDRTAIAAKGYESAIARTWENATTAFEAELKRVLKDRKVKEENDPTNNNPVIIPAPALMDDGAGSKHHCAGIQQPTEGATLYGQPVANHKPDDGRDFVAGRRQPGIQPVRNTPPGGGEADEESEELGFC